ncbi:hypothetical protein ACFXPN_29570 [Streptomyces griseorubiginosus]|uniref:hypothetical protein n=1 Tax=Streptomyces griseorubiginosus TaxID=67304 RepID=UPI0036B38CC9
MTAIDEAAGVGSGKSTQDSGQLSVGDATWALTLPQLPYADAVHAELLAVAMPPSALEAGVRRGRAGGDELFLRAVWPAGTALLGDPVRPYGLTIAWSHVTGWAAHDADGHTLLLDVDVLAAPALIAHAALHLAGQRLDGGESWTPPPGPARWGEAVYLDIALAHYEDREQPLW